MTKQDLLLASNMLKLASEKFSNHGCNDLSNEALSLITDEETICDDISLWNGEDIESWPNNKNQIGDDTLMRFLADKFKKEARYLNY